jgi:hypothetical protein
MQKTNRIPPINIPKTGRVIRKARYKAKHQIGFLNSDIRPLSPPAVFIDSGGFLMD